MPLRRRIVGVWRVSREWSSLGRSAADLGDKYGVPRSTEEAKGLIFDKERWKESGSYKRWQGWEKETAGAALRSRIVAYWKDKVVPTRPGGFVERERKLYPEWLKHVWQKRWGSKQEK